MWRTVLIALSVLLLAISTNASADEGTGGLQCFTCQENCEEEYGVQPGERVCAGVGDPDETPRTDAARPDRNDRNDRTDNNDEPRAVPPAPRFIRALVHWDFVPVIEVRSAEGAVSATDVQRTVQADQQAIADCFKASDYPGGGIVDVDVHLAYNGVPQAVNGNTDGVSPNQARCILRRAWGYEFPRLADEADEPSHLRYRVQFVPQRSGLPDTEPDRPQFLLERVTVDGEYSSPVARGIFAQLPRVERCAAISLEDLPMSLVVTEVDMKWTRQGEQYVARDIDITVSNKSNSDMPSMELLDCYERTLSAMAIEVDDVEAAELETHFYLTVRPAGWYGD